MRPHDTVFKRIDKIERAMCATQKQFQASSRALREKEESINKFDDRINELEARISNVERVQHKLIDRVDLFEVEMQTSVNQQVAIMNEVGMILQGGGGVSSNGIRHRISHEALDNDALVLVEKRLKIMEDSKGQSMLNYDKLQEAHNEAKSSIEELKSSAATNGTLVEDLRQQLAKMDQIASYRYNVHDKALQVHTATHVNQELFQSNMAEVTGMVAKIRFAFSEAISELYKIKADRRDLAKVLSCKEEYGMPMIVKGPDNKLQAELTWTSVPEFDPSGRPLQPRKLLTQSSGKKTGKSPLERVLQLGSPAWSPAAGVPENPDVNVVFDKTLRDSPRSPSPQPDVYEKDSQRRITPKPKNTTKARPASAHSRPSQLRNEVNRTILSDTKRSNTRRSCSEAKAMYQNSNPSTPTTGLINPPEITANLELSSYLQQYSGRSDSQNPGRKNISAKYTTSSRDKITNGRNHKWT